MIKYKQFTEMYAMPLFQDEVVDTPILLLEDIDNSVWLVQSQGYWLGTFTALQIADFLKDKKINLDNLTKKFGRPDTDAIKIRSSKELIALLRRVKLLRDKHVHF